MDIFRQALLLESSPLRGVLCTLVATSGSTPRKAGAKMIVLNDSNPFGSIIGSIGGGAVEHEVRRIALKTIQEGLPTLISINLRNELGMCCGGEMTVFFEPLTKKPPLILFGAGHISQALCPLAISLGYDVSVVDGRRELLDHSAFRQASLRISDTTHFSYDQLPFSPCAHAVIATHDHGLDQQIAEAVLGQEFLYLGLVGSKRKALMTTKRLLAKGYSILESQKITCPAGLPINAATPEEIALSIAAQMILVKNELPKNSSPDYSRRQKPPYGS